MRAVGGARTRVVDETRTRRSAREKRTSSKLSTETRKLATARQARWSSVGRKARGEKRKWGRNCLTLDEARHGGLYIRSRAYRTTL
jgi:hypothetical protein